MSDEQKPEPPKGNAFYIDEHGKRRMTPEHLAKMQAGFEKAKAEGRLWKGGSRPKNPRPANPEQERAIEETRGKMEPLKESAVENLKLILQTRKECGCPVASNAQVISAAKLVLEYVDGKPTQRLEIDDVREIRYELGRFEPLREVSGE